MLHKNKTNFWGDKLILEIIEHSILNLKSTYSKDVQCLTKNIANF